MRRFRLARESEVVFAEDDGIVTKNGCHGHRRGLLAAGGRAGPPAGPCLGRRRHPSCMPSPETRWRQVHLLMTLYTDDEERFTGAREALKGAVQIGPVGTP